MSSVLVMYVVACITYILGWCHLRLAGFQAVKMLPPLIIALCVRGREPQGYSYLTAGSDRYGLPVGLSHFFISIFLSFEPLWWCMIGDLTLIFSSGFDVCLTFGLIAFTMAHVKYQFPEIASKDVVGVTACITCFIMIDFTGIGLYVWIGMYFVLLLNGIITAVNFRIQGGYIAMMISDIIILLMLIGSFSWAAIIPVMSSFIIGLYWLGLWLLMVEGGTTTIRKERQRQRSGRNDSVSDQEGTSVTAPATRT
jgi:hypothetical protein